MEEQSINQNINNNLIKICLNNDYKSLLSLKIDQELLKGTTFFIPRETVLFNIGTAKKDFLPLKSLSLLHIAAYADSLEVFIYLVQQGIPIDIVSADSYLPIHYACVEGSSEVCLYILSQRPDLASTHFSVKYDLITLATRSNSYIILTQLFSCGANMKDPLVQSNNPIQYAISPSKIDILKLLLKNGYYNEIQDHRTLLMIAVAYKAADLVSVLLKSGEDPYIFVEGYNALHLACLNNFPEAVSLICASMITIEPSETAYSVFGTKPVHWGCQSHSPLIVSILLQKGMKINALDDSGQSGPAYMVDSDDDDIIKILELLYNSGLDLEAGSYQFQSKNLIHVKNQKSFPRSI